MIRCSNSVAECLNAQSGRVAVSRSCVSLIPHTVRVSYGYIAQSFLNVVWFKWLHWLDLLDGCLLLERLRKSYALVDTRVWY